MLSSPARGRALWKIVIACQQNCHRVSAPQASFISSDLTSANPLFSTFQSPRLRSHVLILASTVTFIRQPYSPLRFGRLERKKTYKISIKLRKKSSYRSVITLCIQSITTATKNFFVIYCSTPFSYNCNRHSNAL